MAPPSAVSWQGAHPPQALRTEAAAFNTRGEPALTYTVIFSIGQIRAGRGVSPPRGSARIVGFSPANLTRRQKGQMETRPRLAGRA